jgi:hypothetical protein
MSRRIYNPGAYFAVVNAAAAPIKITPEAAAYAEQTRRIAEIRRQLVADGMGWAEANDEAVERVLIAADHHSADDAADAQTGETR